MQALRDPEGSMHGHGMRYYISGVVYDGQWELGKRHGHGKELLADGTSWEGIFRNGQKYERVPSHIHHKKKLNSPKVKGSKTSRKLPNNIGTASVDSKDATDSEPEQVFGSFDLSAIL